MEMKSSIEMLSVLAHEGRLSLLRLLMRRAPEAVRAGEIARTLGLKLNTASVHLGALERAGLISSERRGRAILYRAVPERMTALVDFLVADCCRGRPEICGLPAPSDKLNVLFLCTGNSARSIIAEALLRDAAPDRFRAFSAGLSPREAPHPGALQLLEDSGHATDGLHPKGIETFRQPDAPRMDLVLTVCDLTANVDAPPWPGTPVTAHWGLPDPAEAGIDTKTQQTRLKNCHESLQRRISALAALPAHIDRSSLQHAVDLAAQL